MAAFMESTLLKTNYVLFNAKVMRLNSANKIPSRFSSFFNTARPAENNQRDEDDGGFRKLNLRGDSNQNGGRGRRQPVSKTKILPPRYTRMPIDQDWPSVWPTAQTFKSSVVPLPLRQGYNEKGAPPDKYGNLELMKIPNFLHLTPPAIKRHCEAIKKFCTPWPQELVDDETCEKHFPMTVSTSDYLHSSPSIRDPKARIVNVKINVSNLKLNAHAKDKLLRLVGDRYNTLTNELTIVTDRCPLRKQNYDYGMYLLTALYFESWKSEPWESEKDEEDAECYIWERSQSKKGTITLVKKMKESFKNTNTEEPLFLAKLPDNFEEKDVLTLPEVETYSKAVTILHNEGEDYKTLADYKESVLKVLNFNKIQNTL